MTQTHKSAVHAMVNASFIEVLGGAGDPRAGASVLVILEEVIEGELGCPGPHH